MADVKMMTVECCECRKNLGVKPVTGDTADLVTSTRCRPCLMRLYPEHYPTFELVAHLYKADPMWSDLRFAPVPMEVAV